MVRAVERRNNLGRVGSRDRCAACARNDESWRRRRDARRYPSSGILAETLNALGVGECRRHIAGALRKREAQAQSGRIIIWLWRVSFRANFLSGENSSMRARAARSKF